MTAWHWGAGVGLAVLLFAATAVGLRYSQAGLVFFFVAAILAYPLVQKAKTPPVAVVSLLGLAIFSSFPVRKLMGWDGVFEGALATLGFGLVLFVLGAGWKRRWS